MLYAILLASVAALWRISQDRDGFAPHIPTNRYTWTYGPTAVLIVVIGFWRQVEYYCKLLAPWHQLRRGAGASATLLDYVSPFQFTSFFGWRSIMEQCQWLLPLSACLSEIGCTFEQGCHSPAVPTNFMVDHFLYWPPCSQQWCGNGFGTSN